MIAETRTHRTIIKLTAIVAIAAVLIIALCNGIDSFITGAGMGAIGGIAGYEFRKGKEKNDKGSNKD